MFLVPPFFIWLLSILFSCGLLERFLGFCFALFVVLLSTLLCAVYLVVDLHITIYILLYYSLLTSAL